MTLETVIKLQCRDTAHAIGLFDRGTLEVGMRADLNIFDHDSMKINAPYYVNDLPAKAPRWMQTVSGIKRTLVRGVTTFIDGQHTGALPGSLVRNPYYWKDGVRGVQNTDTVFDDPVRAEILANVADVLAAERKLLSPSTSMDAALDRTMEEGATGPTHMSRMAREMDTEAQQEAKYKRFLDSPLATTLSADKGEEEDGEKQKSKL